MFKRKIYDELVEWKSKYGPKYATMIEGPRRVGKSTVAEEFAKNEFKSYIKIDCCNQIFHPINVSQIYSKCLSIV